MKILHRSALAFLAASGILGGMAILNRVSDGPSSPSTGQQSTGQMEVSTGRIQALLRMPATLALPPLPEPSPSCGSPTPPPAITACGEETANALILDTDWLCIWPRGTTFEYRDGQGLDHYPGRKLQWHGPKPPDADCNASTAWQVRCGYRCIPGRQVLPHRTYAWGRPSQVLR